MFYKKQADLKKALELELAISRKFIDIARMRINCNLSEVVAKVQVEYDLARATSLGLEK